ncbi:MAG: hypothetical protein AOA66_0095 [Candidatus Bathyarchaeota archaeon BA2]|nr:MAG: hypothetical protein AOA66_0095 [Candidatus Bathyarchaeota archaeon BA2]
MGKAKRISFNTLGVIVGLVTSVGWIITGLLGGLAVALKDELASATFIYIVTLVGLILIPICSRENKWGFLSAMVLGIVILVAALPFVTGLVTELPPPESPEFGLVVVGGAIWLIIQIPIIVFSYRAYRKV